MLLHNFIRHVLHVQSDFACSTAHIMEFQAAEKYVQREDRKKSTLVVFPVFEK